LLMGGFAIAKEVRRDPSVYDSLAPADCLDSVTRQRVFL
jgi:hypothetical protein